MKRSDSLTRSAEVRVKLSGLSKLAVPRQASLTVGRHGAVRGQWIWPAVICVGPRVARGQEPGPTVLVTCFGGESFR